MIHHTVISVNKLSIYGAVGDLCNEFDPAYAESVICESLVIPTGSAYANATSQSSTSYAQGNLLQDYFEKFAELLEYQTLSKLCKDLGFLKIEKEQFFISSEEGSEIIETECREYTHSRNFTKSRPRGWIRSNTKIGPVLDVKLYLHEGRYCIDIMIESLFKDRTISRDRIVNGINKYDTGKPVAKLSQVENLL